MQVLPVSDTSVRGTWRDSYPYSALCVFALHPLYLRLQALAGGGLADGRGASRRSSFVQPRQCGSTPQCRSNAGW